MAADPMAEALNDLHEILASYNRTQQAEFVKKLLHWRVSDLARLESALASDETWSGPKALWMVSLYESTIHNRESVQRDEVRFRNAIVKLVEAMEGEGISNPQARKVADRLALMNKLATG